MNLAHREDTTLNVNTPLQYKHTKCTKYKSGEPKIMTSQKFPTSDQTQSVFGETVLKSRWKPELVSGYTHNYS
jgi:hypothetical protein